MKNADFLGIKEERKLDNYHQKKMIKEHLLQEAEKLTKQKTIKRKQRQINIVKQSINGKQDFYGRNIFIEEAIEKNYSSLLNFKNVNTKTFKSQILLRKKLVINEAILKGRDDN